MNSTLVFALMMFLPNNTQVMAVFPTHEDCLVEAARVNADLKNLPHTNQVGVACVPSNQYQLSDVKSQMQSLITIMRDLDFDTGRVGKKECF